MNNTTHPIDQAIALLLIAFEGLCWMINEACGFHVLEPEVVDPRAVYAIEAAAPVEPEFIEADFTCYEEPVPFDCTFTGGSHDLDWTEPFSRLAIRSSVDLASLKVTELRRKAKGLAKGVHLMRKAELVALLA